MKTNKPKLFKPNTPKSVKNLSWPQAKARFPLMKPYGDVDGDGLKNFRDCKPFDIKRKGEEHKDKRGELAKKHNVPSDIFDIEESDEVAEEYHRMFGY